MKDCSQIQAVLVDASWVLSRSFFSPAGKDMSVVIDGQQVMTGDIYGFVTAVTRIRSAFRRATIFLCVDQKGGDYAKKDGVDGYKEGRVSAKGQFSKLDECLAASCLVGGCCVAGADRREGDEVIVSLARILKDKGVASVAFAIDKDIRQALSDLEYMFTKFRKGLPFEPFTAKDLMDKTGVKPSSFALYQAIVGDKCDRVQGIKRFPKKEAARIANVFEHPNQLCDPGRLSKLPVTAVRALDKVRDVRDQVEKDYGLTFMGGVLPEEITYTVVPGGETVLEKYQLREFHTFVNSKKSRREG